MVVLVNVVVALCFLLLLLVMHTSDIPYGLANITSRTSW